MSDWRIAKCLDTLRDQINALHPDRDKSSDGTIGDASHQARKSDHNPDAEGVVRALDITHDPAHGVDSYVLAETLRVNRDPRISYIISNRRIANSKVDHWEWRPYTGADPHTEHLHLSVVADDALADDTRPWVLTATNAASAAKPGRMTGITATVFGGSSDPNTSAYDNHRVSDTELGCALPYRFAKPLPKVRVFASSGASVDCAVVDVGPWNTDDPYWQSSSRPQAESGTDRHGRHTNLAGIDLTPAAARAVGINGKGVVDWQFITETSMTDTTTNTPTTLPALPGLTNQIGLDAIEQAVVTAMRDPAKMSQIAEAIDRAKSIIDALRGIRPGAQPQPSQVIPAVPLPNQPATPTAPTSAIHAPSLLLGILGLLGSVAANAAGVMGSPAGAGATVAGQMLPTVFAALTGTGFAGGLPTLLRAILIAPK